MNPAESVIEAPLERPARGFATTRAGGASCVPFDSLNLGGAGDPVAVTENRRRLSRRLPSAPCWLEQVHGNRVICLEDWHDGIEADAAWTAIPGQVAAVLTADCLPILLADRLGTCVAAVHAGWRGLASGVIANTIAALPVAPVRLTAWIGPRISQSDYEVGRDVRTALQQFAARFRSNRPGHWLADLAGIAFDQLAAAGVDRVLDSGENTAGKDRKYFSFRRDGRAGRMATLVWIEG